MLLFPTDQIVRRQGSIGNVELGTVQKYLVSSILPSFFTEKREEAIVDIIAWEFGIRGYGSVARPVLGMPASTLSVAGIIGGLAIVFCTILPFLALTNILFGPVKNSLFAPVGVGLVVPYVEKIFVSYWVLTLRELATIWVLFSLILIVASVLRKHQYVDTRGKSGIHD
jgi:hypothetical protein